jgi:hypothetical protein
MKDLQTFLYLKYCWHGGVNLNGGIDMLGVDDDKTFPLLLLFIREILT